jgi:hypothetical protein
MRRNSQRGSPNVRRAVPYWIDSLRRRAGQSARAALRRRQSGSLAHRGDHHRAYRSFSGPPWGPTERRAARRLALGLPIRRSSAQAVRACWTISGFTGNSRTLCQVIDHGGWTGAACTARLHMPNEVSGRQIERIDFAERVALQVFQMGLLAALPARDRLDGVDVTADQLRKGGRSLLDRHQGCRAFECELVAFWTSSGSPCDAQRYGFPDAAPPCSAWNCSLVCVL